jgi:3'-5' exoribonuclease
MTEQVDLPIMLDHVDVRDLHAGQEIHQCLVVQSAERRESQEGTARLVLRLGDRTGTVEAVVWPVKGGDQDEVARVAAEAEVGAPLRLKGTVEVHEKYGTRIKLQEKQKRVSIKAAQAGEYDPDRLQRGPAQPVAELEAHLATLVCSVSPGPLFDLLALFFHPAPTFSAPGSTREEYAEFYAAFREAPAARNVHQGYRHGLLEHTVGVAQAVWNAATDGVLGTFNVDLAVTGALLHDIGKVNLYTRGGLATEMTTSGMLIGEMPLSLSLVERAISTIDDFPEPLALGVMHIVASHHGRTEWGATATPATREAMLVHGMDVLAARLGAFDRLEAERPAGEEWSGFDRSLDGRVWFG